MPCEHYILTEQCFLGGVKLASNFTKRKKDHPKRKRTRLFLLGFFLTTQKIRKMLTCTDPRLFNAEFLCGQPLKTEKKWQKEEREGYYGIVRKWKGRTFTTLLLLVLLFVVWQKRKKNTWELGQYTRGAGPYTMSFCQILRRKKMSVFLGCHHFLLCFQFQHQSHHLQRCFAHTSIYG